MHFDPQTVRDEIHDVPVHSTETVFTGAVWDVHADEFDYTSEAGTQKLRREYVRHTGSVAIAAVNENNELLLIQQYRHPVGQKLWEIPAGLLDHEGEDMLQAAQRELAEESDLVADTWHILIDCYTSPGGQTESCRIYLATDLKKVPEEQRHDREGEEIDMQTAWIELAQAEELVYAGKLHNPFTVMSVLALNGRARELARPADAPWLPQRQDS
ncbi:NUDIX domain-containing protein [Micrococcoides hystricis]|uniref:NUDIX domain-containing protein n=1 Tax=Micrococcoides hystricis TaxID=1572761 RepID=A0ABV6P6P5_9MICC